MTDLPPASQALPTEPVRLRAGFKQTTTFFWWIPLLLAAVAGLLTYAIVANQDNVFRASAELLVPIESTLEPQAYADLARSEAILTDTIRELRLTTSIDSLRNDIHLTIQDTLITIETDAPTSADAQLLATRISNAVIRNTPDLLAAAPPSLLGNITGPRNPIDNNSALYTSLAVAAGLALGIILTGALALRERPVQFPSDIQWLAGLPTIAAIPRSHNVDTPALISKPHSPEAAAHRNLQTTVEQLRGNKNLHTILLVGIDPKTGASSIAVNLALAFSEIGRHVLLIDADLHNPTIHRLLHLPNQNGLSDARFSTGAPTIYKISGSTLRVVTSGVLPPQPSQLLATPRVAALLTELPHTAELAIINAPALTQSDGAAILAEAADGIVLIVDTTRTRAEELRAAGRTMRTTGKPILGVVLSNTHSATSQVGAYPSPAHTAAVDVTARRITTEH